jgi:hypothetical protein
MNLSPVQTKFEEDAPASLIFSDGAAATARESMVRMSHKARSLFIL